MDKNIPLVLTALLFTMSSTYAEVTTDVVCSYAPSQSATVNRISSIIGGAGAGTEITLLTSGLTVVTHSSGAPILSGTGGYIAGTMTGAMVATTLVTAAVVVSGATVTFELACAPKNHPDLVSKILDGAKEYQAAGKEKLEKLTGIVIKYQTVTRDKFYELMGETWYQKMIRKTKQTLGIP